MTWYFDLTPRCYTVLSADDSELETEDGETNRWGQARTRGLVSSERPPTSRTSKYQVTSTILCRLISRTLAPISGLRIFIVSFILRISNVHNTANSHVRNYPKSFCSVYSKHKKCGRLREESGNWTDSWLFPSAITTCQPFYVYLQIWRTELPNVIVPLCVCLFLCHFICIKSKNFLGPELNQQHTRRKS